jgi:hypothetical protein
LSNDFQRRVESWLTACFSPEIGFEPGERMHRFLEEALELAQASGCSREEARMLLDYVFSRPPGRPAEEAGGVLVTLAGLCSAIGVNMTNASEAELARNWDRIEAIRSKRATKQAGSPLPQ